MPLLSVYNNLIQGYVANRQTRFDTHKRSELTEIYRRMRKINSEQPLYKINFDKDVQEYTLTVKEQALSLSAAAKELGSRDEYGVFSKKCIASDKPEAVEVNNVNVFSGNGFEKMEVRVNSLATHQVNGGRLVTSRETGVNAGQYSFTVEIDGSFYSFQYNVDGTSSNEDLQERLAEFINKTKIGISAKVERDWLTKSSRIEIEGNEDGMEFSFRDTKIPYRQEQGIVEFFGLNDVTKPAGKTVANINGEIVESRNREYVTNAGLKLLFRKVTEDEPVAITEVVDDTAAMDKVKQFVDKYNALHGYVRNASNTRTASKKLFYEMNAMLSRHKEELFENGIELNKDGQGSLVINESKMTEAIKSGSMENMFTESTGVIGRISGKLLDVSLNPMNYVDKMIVVYPNTRAKKSYNPYVTSIYSGMMFNNYC